MKKYISILLLTVLTFAATAQDPDTTTLEKKARYYTARIKDNNKRAITPQDFRKAFNANINLALADAIPDTTTHPAPSLLPADYPEGLSLYQIKAADGWPFDGSLLVQRSSDGHAVQTITSALSSFADQRIRTSYVTDWTTWDCNSASVTVDPPSLADGEQFELTIAVPGVDRVSRVKRLSFSGALEGVLILNNVPSDNTVRILFWNTTGATVDVGAGVVSVLTVD